MFNINILNGSGEFELLEGGSITVSGCVKLLTESSAENQMEHLTAISEQMDLNSDDFYKELRLRGYQYKDEFLGFLKANGEGKLYNQFVCKQNITMLLFFRFQR